MTYVFVAVLSSAATVGAIYAWVRWNEWRWDRDEAKWDNEL